MAIREAHMKAMEIAELAEEAKRAKDLPSARVLFTDAFKLEREAAGYLFNELDAEPTRSVLYRSAAALAVDCGEYREAERLAATGLMGNPPHEIAEELRDLLEQVQYQRHFDVRGSYLSSADVQISLTGESVGFGIVKAEQFLQRAESFGKIVSRTAERLLNKPFRNTGRVSKDVSKQFDLAVTVPRGGSFAISFKLESVGEQPVLTGLDVPTNPDVVVKEVMDCLELFARSDTDALRARIPDPDYYDSFIGLARQIGPDGVKVNFVNFTALGMEGYRQIQLADDVKKIPLGPRSEVKQLTSAPETVVTITGRLKAATSVKESENSITVVESVSGKPFKFVVSNGVIADIVRPLYEDLVRVEYTKRGRINHLIDIQQVTEESLL